MKKVITILMLICVSMSFLAFPVQAKSTINTSSMEIQLYDNGHGEFTTKPVTSLSKGENLKIIKAKKISDDIYEFIADDDNLQKSEYNKLQLQKIDS